MKNKKEKQKFVRVSSDTHRILKILAAEFGLTIDETIKKILRAYRQR